MSFTSLNVFNLPSANRIIDRFYFHIDEHYKKIPLTLTINEELALTGKAASIIQGGSIVAVNQIVFALRDSFLDSVIRDVIPKEIANKGVIKFKDRTVFFFDDFILEFWKLDSLTIVLEDSIYCQLISEIPSDLL